MSYVPVVVQAGLAGATGGVGFPVPVTDDEVVRDAVAAWDAGAAMIHLRARRPDGTPSGRVEHFAPLIEGIRAEGCDAILELCCGPPDADGLDCLALQPELVSLGGWSDDVGGAALDGPRQLLREALAKVRDAGVAVELRCHGLGHLRTLLSLRDEGLLEDPLRVQLVVDDRAPKPIEQVLGMSSLLPADAIWSVAGTGAAQLRLNVLCLIAGGHVRTGLEDNFWLVEDVPATNEELVQRVVRIIDDLDRPLATPAEARDVLRLRGTARSPFRAMRSAASLSVVDLPVATG